MNLRKKSEQKIDQDNAEVQVALQNSNHNQISIVYGPKEHVSDLLSKSKFGEAAEYLREILKLYEQAHPLYPHYIYKPTTYGKKTVFEHVPINEQAAREHPLRYKGKLSFNKEQIGTAKNLDELFTRAFINQENIKININFIETWIGNHKIDDEGTFMKEAAKDGDWIIVPEKLPPPIKVKFVISNKKGIEKEITLLDYIELNVINIDKERDIIVFDNSRQTNCPLLVTWLLCRKETEMLPPSIDLTVKKPYWDNLEANYKFLLYLANTSKGGRLGVVDLEENVNILSSEDYNVEISESLSTVESELDFVKKLIEIEKHFNIKLNIPKEITDDDWDTIDILMLIIEHKSIDETWREVIIGFDNPKGIKTLINHQKKEKSFIICQHEDLESIKLFNQTIKGIQVKREFHNASIQDIEKLKKKQAVMEEGDLIKFKIISNSNKNLKTRYYFNGSK
ncbi:hypothetical protein ACFVSZ_28330 [Priestia megaterium]|uniref:hypothetical protein n=1 Tax=Priestia megaterium TaxID=1404 RepID=UPI0036DC1D36